MIPSSGSQPWPPDHPRTFPRTGSPTPPPGARPIEAKATRPRGLVDPLSARHSRWFGSCLAVIAVWLTPAMATQGAPVDAAGAAGLKHVLQLRSLIGPDSTARVQRLLGAATKAGSSVFGVSLDSAGGTLELGAELARLVAAVGLDTYVEDGATCSSACFLVFAAGKRKFASYGARIGVQSGKYPEGDPSRAAAETEEMRRLLGALGVPPSIITKMAQTPNEKVVWLSVPELRSMGVTLLSGSE